MSSFRHKAAKSLIELLCQKTAEVHARTGYCPPLSNRSLLDNKNNEQPQNSLDGDDDKFYQRPTLLSLPTFDDALSSMETSLLLGSANDDYSDQHRDNIPSIDIDSLGRLPAIFDQYIGQDTMRSSQEISESALNPIISLLVGSNEGSVSTLTPFTPDHYELGNDSPGEALFWIERFSNFWHYCHGVWFFSFVIWVHKMDWAGCIDLRLLTALSACRRVRHIRDHAESVYQQSPMPLLLTS